MKNLTVIFFVLVFFDVQAVVYDSVEINRELTHPELQIKTQNYISRYFTDKNPDEVIDELINADLLPIQKEYILQQLLTEIALQPPQEFFKVFVARMKKYPTEATKVALEGPLPIPIFNINSKAYGIENIWTAYQTEQRFNQLFNKSIPEAINAIAVAIVERSRPKWLGIKNSIAALSKNQKQLLANHLSTEIKINEGLDKLISHVGLIMAEEFLIRKALASKQQPIREYTLRQSVSRLPKETAKQLLLETAKESKDQKFSISLLHQFSDDHEVSEFLIEQLNNKQLADSAAFSLSQSQDINLPQLLLQKYHHSSSETEKNHILLALKLNKSDAAQLALHDIKLRLNSESKQSQWLKSFDGAAQ